MMLLRVEGLELSAQGSGLGAQDFGFRVCRSLLAARNATMTMNTDSRLALADHIMGQASMRWLTRGSESTSRRGMSFEGRNQTQQDSQIPERDSRIGVVLSAQRT
eukprot:698774-Rhodomonas_salina.3